MRAILGRVGLARLLRLGLTLAIPALWYEISVLHYRGAFQSKFMWVPVLSLPAAIAGGLASGLKKDERRSRESFSSLCLVDDNTRNGRHVFSPAWYRAADGWFL